MEMSPKLSKAILLFFVFAHFVLACVYATVTPYRQSGILLNQRGIDGNYATAKDIGAPDERQHANYIGHLMSKKSLPVFDPKSTNLYEEYQAHQPPLYYGISSVEAMVSGAGSPDDQSFKRLRYFNVIFGCFTVFGVYLAGLWSLRSHSIALGAAAFVALLPMNAALSGAISNDPLLIALSTFCIAYCLKSFKNENEDGDFVFVSNDLVAAGLFAGLACLTKSSGLIAMITFFATCGVHFRGQVPFRKRVLSAMVIPLLFAAPVWLRNQSLYGDPLAQSAFKQAFGGSAQKSTMLGVIEASNAAGSPEVQYWINWVGYWTARSFIGVFGYMDIYLNASGKALSNSDPNLLYKAMIAIHFLTMGAAVLISRKQKAEGSFLGISILTIVLSLLVFAAFNNTYFQAQARYLFPALSAFALLSAYGWNALFKKSWILTVGVITLIYGGLNYLALSQLSQEFAKRITSG